MKRESLASHRTWAASSSFPHKSYRPFPSSTAAPSMGPTCSWQHLHHMSGCIHLHRVYNEKWKARWCNLLWFNIWSTKPHGWKRYVLDRAPSPESLFSPPGSQVWCTLLYNSLLSLATWAEAFFPFAFSAARWLFSSSHSLSISASETVCCSRSLSTSLLRMVSCLRTFCSSKIWVLPPRICFPVILALMLASSSACSWIVASSAFQILGAGAPQCHLKKASNVRNSMTDASLYA